MPSRRTNNFSENGRGLGHVTPTIFGSTVGYPSDSLASCCCRRRQEKRKRRKLEGKGRYHKVTRRYISAIGLLVGRTPLGRFPQNCCTSRRNQNIQFL